MANIVYKTHSDLLDYPADRHILTFAEHGFAPLDIHGRKLGVSRDTLGTFADAVNQADEVGTLYPEAPISAVPRPCIRDTTDPAALLLHLQDFLNANAAHMKATSLVLDFSTPRLQPHVQQAIEAVFNRPGSQEIHEIIVIRN